MNLGIPILDKLPISDIGMKARALLPSARHTDILKSIDTSFLLFDNILLNTATGATEEVLAGEEEAFADALARAANRLRPNRNGSCHILLLLPTNDFVATSYSMGVTGENLIRSALELQAQTLLPAYDERLLLAVNAGNQEGVALWFNESKANRLFRAFEREGLFLAAIMPRSLALMNTGQDEDSSVLIHDKEGRDVSLIQAKGADITRLLTVNRADLEQEVFAKQWELETNQLRAETEQHMESLEDWQALKKKVQPVPDYCFLPAGAIAEEKRISLARKSKAGLAVAACLVLLLFAPFVSNWLKIRELQEVYELVQSQTEEPRALQAAIFDMEEEWGALWEYPDQQVADVLVSLNNVIQSSLTTFAINKGVIDITGSTADPAYLVELLAEREEFYNVGQSTNTRGGGSRFGIRMNLSSVDFEAYEEKYPVLSQGR